MADPDPTVFINANADPDPAAFLRLIRNWIQLKKLSKKLPYEELALVELEKKNLICKKNPEVGQKLLNNCF